MGSRFKWAVSGVLALLVISLAGVLLFPRLLVYSLARQLDTAPTAAAAADLVRDLLRRETEQARDAVAEYAGRSPLRAYARKHGLFLLHDDATGDTYEVVVAKQGWVEVPDNLDLHPADRKRLGEFAHRTLMSKPMIEKYVIGNPPAVYSGIHLLPKGLGQDSSKGERVNFILKERDEPRYARIAFTFEDSSLVATTFYGVSESELREWRSSPS